MTCSYDDRASNGRLVFFWPTSYCWKCRFVQRYEDDGTVGKETPRQTAFKAHPAGDCAEDLCHALCIYIVLEPCRSAKPYVLVVNFYCKDCSKSCAAIGQWGCPQWGTPAFAVAWTTPQLAQKLVI
jgi:hypothetical protein